MNLEALSIPEPNTGCWIWLGALRGPRQYGGYGRKQYAHRAAWESVNGPVPNGLWVLHKCDVSLCVNPDHLYVGDVRQNVADMMQRGRHRPMRGDKCGRSKLVTPEVRWIRHLLSIGFTHARIAEAFEVGEAAISHIATGRNWSHIQ